MPLARVDEVVAGVAALISDLWNPAEPDEVVVDLDDDFQIETDPTHPNALTGRKVYVLPESYDTPEPNARGDGHDYWDFGIVIIIARRYTDDDGDVKTWLQGERYWVQENVYKPLTDPRLTLLPDSASGGLYPVAPSGVDPVYDLEELQRKLFFSAVRVTFREETES